MVKAEVVEERFGSGYQQGASVARNQGQWGIAESKETSTRVMGRCSRETKKCRCGCRRGSSSGGLGWKERGQSGCQFSGRAFPATVQSAPSPPDWPVGVPLLVGLRTFRQFLCQPALFPFSPSASRTADFLNFFIFVRGRFFLLLFFYNTNSFTDMIYCRSQSCSRPRHCRSLFLLCYVFPR